MGFVYSERLAALGIILRRKRMNNNHHRRRILVDDDARARVPRMANLDRDRADFKCLRRRRAHVFFVTYAPGRPAASHSAHAASYFAWISGGSSISLHLNSGRHVSPSV